ncbi:hypothetical protein [Acidovorax sp. BL-A-41-H1]|uniref:hypothetical protein n=1 Tax=Acidovorax sp. BL-A-41-H1 TaxID=3421102 RepID=UPI003F79AE5E
MLAASSPKLRGLNDVMANQDRMQQQALQQQYLQSQIDENKTQNKMREQQMKAATDRQAWEQSYYFGEQAPNPQGAGYISGNQSNGQVAPTLGGNASPVPSAGKFDEWSRLYGIPKDALIADWKNNGGKKIAEMLMQRGAPDMQVTNGYAYDKNRLSAGYLPQLNISNDGKATQVRIGPDGQPVVSAPQGAPETFGTYQGIQAGIQSANTPLKVFNPQTQREEFVPQSTALRGATAQPQYSGAGYNGGSAASAAPEQLQIMQSELNRLPPNHPDRPAIMREMQRLGGGQQVAQSGNFAAGPSADETASAEALRARMVGTAKADVERDTGRQSEAKRYGQLTAGIDRAIDLLNQGPTASGVGALVDKGLGSVGASTRGSVAASQLETLSGWLVSNVPRMEGPQSNVDVLNYQTMAGTVGDRTRPIAERLAAAKEVKKLQDKYASLNGGGGGGDAPAKEQPAPAAKEFSMLPKATEFDGKRMRAPDGSIYRSTGGKWVKE